MNSLERLLCISYYVITDTCWLEMNFLCSARRQCSSSFDDRSRSYTKSCVYFPRSVGRPVSGPYTSHALGSRNSLEMEFHALERHVLIEQNTIIVTTNMVTPVIIRNFI